MPRRFTYSINFAAFITAIAGEAAVWNVPKGIDGGIIFLLVPIVLICINSLGVRVRSIYVGPVLRISLDSDLNPSFTVSLS